MKKMLLLPIAVMLMALTVQAQTCKIASVNGKKVVQIEVNLDNLEGKTLVTTINNTIKDSLVLNMAFEEGLEAQPAAETAREDSSENLAAENENSENPVVEEPTAENAEIAEATEPEAGESENKNEKTKEATMAGSLLNTFGLGEVGNLLGSLTATNGEPYEEYLRRVTEVDSTQYIPQYKQRKWKWLNRYNTYLTLKLSGIFGKDYDDDKESEEVDSEDYGANPDKKYNIGGSIDLSQVFILGRYDADGNFKPNKINFGWSIGALFAMDHQEDYGWSWDLMGKLGIQAGNGITLGADLLVGLGGTTYAIYSTDQIDYRVSFHDQLCFKYGAQAWLSMNYGGNTYTTLFARIVRSVAPSEIYNHPTAKNWENVLIDFDEGSWQLGFAVGYKFANSNDDIKNKRLQATVSAGYTLFGADQSGVMLYELEKYTQIRPTLQFAYGLGYEQGIGKDKLQGLVINGGWLFKLNQDSKFAYLTKFYAGIGEYLVMKNSKSVNEQFKMNRKVQQLCPKVGAQLGVAYTFGCSSLNLSLRGGYHKGFDTEYEGYETAETSDLSGFELTPFLGYSLKF